MICQGDFDGVKNKQFFRSLSIDSVKKVPVGFLHNM